MIRGRAVVKSLTSPKNGAPRFECRLSNVPGEPAGDFYLWAQASESAEPIHGRDFGRTGFSVADYVAQGMGSAAGRK